MVLLVDLNRKSPHASRFWGRIIIFQPGRQKRIVYRAKIEDKWLWVDDGKQVGDSYDVIGLAVFSADGRSMAFTAKKGGKGMRGMGWKGWARGGRSQGAGFQRRWKTFWLMC